MDNAVALVSAYLQVNGYFCVTEYPLLEKSRDGDVRTVSDLDILAFRFPGAGREVRARRKGHIVGDTRFEPDPALGTSRDLPDMIVGEVKRGRAQFNPATRKPEVLAAALARFGCCDPEHASGLAHELLRAGVATNRHGHRVRMIAFGGIEPDTAPATWHVLSLERIVTSLERHLHENWNVLRQVSFGNDVLDLLSLLERTRKRAPHTARSVKPPGRG
jgi:hypothetical protein